MKIKLKELFRKKEDDLDLNLDEELNDPDIRIETYEMTEDPQAKEELWDKIKKHQKFVHNRNAITMGLLFILLFGLGTFLFFHTGSTYLTSDRIERNDVSSTQYLEFGDYFLKYSSDGVACVDSKSNIKWSTTYSMQAPFVDVCGTTAVIADQQGMQVYVFDEEGLKGQFQITQGKASEVAEKSKQYDLVISTTVLGGECHCPLIIGTPFLLGRGTEPIVDQIVEVLQK